MGSPFSNHEIFVGTRGIFIMDLVIAYEVMSPRGENKQRHRDPSQMVYGDIIDRIDVQAIKGVPRADRPLRTPPPD